MNHEKLYQRRVAWVVFRQLHYWRVPPSPLFTSCIPLGRRETSIWGCCESPWAVQVIIALIQDSIGHIKSREDRYAVPATRWHCSETMNTGQACTAHSQVQVYGTWGRWLEAPGLQVLTPKLQGSLVYNSLQKLEKSPHCQKRALEPAKNSHSCPMGPNWAA